MLFRNSLLLFFVSFFFFTSCFSKKTPELLLINGAGASFPYILYLKWISEYRKQESLVAVNYQSIGSGGGIRQFLAGSLDFGATDVPVSAEELKGATKKLLHIPTTLGAVAVTYNLPSLKPDEALKLSGGVLSEIFLGAISYWDDPKIKELNPSLSLPHSKIILIYRADGSGTTSFFTEFLSSKSPEFLKKIGKGKSVSWPLGLGAKGNEGVMGLLNRIEGGIAYIGLSYAMSQKLPRAALKNKEGFFVQPSFETVQSSALQALKEKKSYTDSLVDKEGKNSYPIVGYTYILLSKKLPSQKGLALINFMKWSLSEGQQFSKPLYFVPLPEKILKSAIKELSQIEFH